MRSLESSTNNLLEKRPTNQKTYSENGGTLSDDAFTLYYGRFRSNAPKIKALVSLIEERVEKAEPYRQVLTDIYTCYCHQREQLIGPGVYSSFNDLKGKVEKLKISFSYESFLSFRYFFDLLERRSRCMRISTSQLCLYAPCITRRVPTFQTFFQQ